VSQAYSSAPEGSTTAQPRALHAAASPCGIGRERRSLRGDARRSARLWRPHREVSQRRLGSALAGWPGNAVLHACSRSAPSRAGLYARASARIPVAKRGGVRDLELGKAVEGVRVAWRPRPRFLRNRQYRNRPPQECVVRRTVRLCPAGCYRGNHLGPARRRRTTAEHQCSRPHIGLTRRTSRERVASADRTDPTGLGTTQAGIRRIAA